MGFSFLRFMLIQNISMFCEGSWGVTNGLMSSLTSIPTPPDLFINLLLPQNVYPSILNPELSDSWVSAKKDICGFSSCNISTKLAFLLLIPRQFE